MSIVTRIFMLIAFTLLLIAGGELFNGFQLRQKRLQEFRSDTKQLARIAELHMVQILEGAHQLLATLSKRPYAHGWDEGACSMVGATASSDFEYDHIVATDRSGILLCSSNGPKFVGTMTPDRDLVDRIVKTSKFVVGAYGIGRFSGNEVIRVGYPMIDDAGAVTGTIYAGINVTWLNTALSQWQLGEQAAIVITDRSGVVIARHPDSRGVGQRIAGSLQPFLTAAEMGTTELAEVGGANRRYGYVPVNVGPSNGLAVFVGRDQVQAIADINRSIWLNAAVIVSGLLLSAVVAIIYVRLFLARPFQDLLAIAGRWRDGDWSARAGVTSGVIEFDRLAVTLDEMAAAVGDRERALQFTNSLLQTEMENSLDGILVVNQSAEILLSNRRFADIWRIPPELIEARADEPVFATVTAQVQDPDGFRERVQYLYKKPSEQSDDEVILRDGRIIDRHSTPLKAADGQYLGRTWFFRDITEKKRSEIALRSERDFTAALLSSLPGLFVSFDEKGRITRWNENLSIVTGRSNEQLLDADAFALIVESDRDAAREKFAEVLKVGYADIEFGVHTKSNSVREFHWSARSVAGDEHFSVIAVGVDVTEARTTEMKLRASEEALAEAQAIAHVGNWKIDQHTGRVSWSDEVFQIFGVDPQKFVPSYEAILNRTHPEDRAPLGKAYADALAVVSKEQSHKVLSIDHRIVLDDGSIRFVHERGRMIFDEKGDPARSVGTVQDITERKIAEDALKHERDFSAALIDGLPGLFFVLDSNGKTVRFNATLSEVTSWSNDELAGMEVLRNVVPDDHALVRSKMREAIETGQADLEVGVPNHSTGVISRFLISGRRISIDNKPGIIGIGFDVTEARRTEAALRESQQIVRAILDAVPVRIFWKNKDLVYLGCNKIFAQDAGFSRPEDIVGKDDYQMGWRDQANLYRTDDRRVIESGLNRLLIEEPQTTPEGKVIALLTSKLPLRSSNGEVVGVLGTYMDITDRKQMEEKLVRLARHDFLTGIPNRIVFVEELERAIARAHRDDESFAVLYLDLDHFKDVNDTLGHPVGDLLLQEVAQRLKSTIRETDIVARFGGDEFALLDTDIGEPADVAVLADKVLKVLSEPYSIQGNDIRSGASVGIAVYGLDSPDTETLLSHADVALYRAKSEGRGTYRFFTDAMDKDVRMRVTLAAEFRVAITAGQLFLVYQPQVNVDTGRIIGVEALVRWRHPTRGFVSPGEFIPVAERSGLIVALGHWVLHEACRQLKEWLDAGIALPLMGINVSGLQFKTPRELENDIAGTLAEFDLSPEHLELELTETVFMEASREHNDVLLRLRKTGLRLAIDDFGTGYSSLEYLGRFPVDRVKIAQNFIVDLVSGSGNATIVKAAIGMAHDLGLDVIIEGVETAEQLALIRSFSGHKVQGFYFSKPLPANEATAVLRTGKIVPPRPVETKTAAE